MTALSKRLLFEFNAFTLDAIASLGEIAVFFEGHSAGNTLLVKPDAYVLKRTTDAVTNASTLLRGVTKKHELKVTLQNSELNMAVRSVPFAEHQLPTLNHNSIKSTWDAFVADMKNPANLKVLCDAFTERKYQLLHGRSVEESVPPRIKDVKFVEVITAIGGSMRLTYITPQTFKTHCTPLVNLVLDRMTKEGYLLAGDGGALFQFNPKPCKVGDIYPANIESVCVIGKHCVTAISHIFDDFYARAIALERAKRGVDSFYIKYPVGLPALEKVDDLLSALQDVTEEARPVPLRFAKKPIF